MFLLDPALGRLSMSDVGHSFGVENHFDRRKNDFMKTLSITESRERLGYWLKRALEGEDIGVLVDGMVVALRPVEVFSGDYILQEYKLTEKEADTAAQRISAGIVAERKAGTIKPFTGNLHELRN